jgi:putative heme-binding domain-containing protein
MERGVGAVIRISLPKTLPAGGGIKLAPKHYEGTHDIGNLATSHKPKPDNSELFARIDKTEMPAAYAKMPHQEYVDKRMEEMPQQNRGRVGQLWNEFRKANPKRSRDGQMFIRILEHVAGLDTAPKRRFVQKWQHHYFGNAPDQLSGRSLERGKMVFEQATCSRCHKIGGNETKLGPDLSDVTKRFKGSKLLQQIVKPSSEIHKEFKTQMILVDDGRLLTGLVIEETNDQIRLLPNLLKPEKIETIRKPSIEERITADVSTMPVGLLDTYTAEEILDLVAFIQSASPAKGSTATN